jgi:hypothetical protein
MTELEKAVEEHLKWYNQTSRGVETGKPEQEFVESILALIQDEVRKAYDKGYKDGWNAYNEAPYNPVLFPEGKEPDELKAEDKES